MKPLAESKTRLEKSIPDDRRSLLSLGMLARVVISASSTPYIDDVVVYGGDGPVRNVCDHLGAGWRPDPGAGLNGCLRVAFLDAAENGFEYALFLPADLPLATAGDLSRFLQTAGNTQLALVPDLANDGTNALLINLSVSFPTLLGEASFDRHVKQAEQDDIDYITYRSERLGLDIDTASDLERLMKLAPNLWDDLQREIPDAGLDASLPVDPVSEGA